jgi:ABC-2 type transport system ATP-binding protein
LAPAASAISDGRNGFSSRPATVIQATDVVMRYRAEGPDALAGVDLRVAEGEVMVLLGPNGAGKTTLVEILEGYRARSGGEVAVLGRDPETADDSWRSQVGIVLQSWRDHPRWQVAELVAHVASFYDTPRSPREVIELVGLGAQGDQPAETLSGGQRRRLDIALGIVGRPRVLFLDEPTAGLDPVGRREVHDVIGALARADSVSVLLTTHDLAEAERLADRITILVSGRVAASGTAPDLTARVTSEAEIRWTEDGRPRRLRTADPSGELWRMHRERQGPISGVEVIRPTLEDTYLRMVRQAESEEGGI